MDKHTPADYFDLSLELWTVKDLTDALGPQRSADILETSLRSIYTIRNSNSISSRRMQRLIAAIRENEPHYRSVLVTHRSQRDHRAAAKQQRVTA